MGGSRIEHGFRKAFCKLVPTFVVASGIYYVVRMVEGRPVPLLYNILHGETALPIPFTWYVPAILVLYAIFYLTDRLARRNWAFLLGVTAGVVGYWCLMVIVLHWQFFWWKSVFGFVSGILFAAFEPTLRKLVTSKPLVVYAISMLLFGSALYLCTFDGFAVRCSAMQLYLALIGPIVALVMYSFPCPKVFGLIGTVSYELYIVHGAFVFAFERIVDCKFLYIGAVLTTSIFAACVLKKGMEWISKRIFAIRRP